MDWSILNLPDQLETDLRQRYGIHSADQVVSMAWGAPALLETVLSHDLVERIRHDCPRPGNATWDSSEFALGARLGPPANQLCSRPDFEAVRADLIEKLQHALSREEQEALRNRLVDLYRAEPFPE